MAEGPILQEPSDEELAELNRRFGFYRVSPVKMRAYDYLRDVMLTTATVVLRMTPDSREREFALTHLESAYRWARCAIERNVPD